MEAIGTLVTLSEVTQGQRALGSGGEQRRSPAAAPDGGLFLPEDHGPVTANRTAAGCGTKNGASVRGRGADTGLHVRR